MSGTQLMKVDDLHVSYGGIQAVKGISFEVNEGEVVSLIGANGAGKSTTLKAITGLQPIRSGTASYLGKPIAGQGAWNLVPQGLVMVPEGRGTFTRMSIDENLLMSASWRMNAPINRFSSMLMRVKVPRPSGTITSPWRTRSQAP